MQLLDWSIVLSFVLVLVWAALSTRKYTRSVSAFLAAERCGGRYLIAIADEMSKLGVITLVWYFELNYRVGFTAIWWALLEGPALIVMALSGWVIYRYRQTRAMTLAQFFEIRYSRNFRIFAGLLAYVAGIINFGIFPSIGARFFIALCDLPATFSLVGVELATYPILMIALLGLALVFTLLGGQIAVIVTDFIQGALSNTAFLVIIVFLLINIQWDRIGEVLLSAPEQASMVHPFRLGKEDYFDPWYFVIGVVVLFYCARGWQGTQGYNCAAKNAHEAKMAGILAGWRFRVLMLVTLIVPICVRTFVEHPDFAADAAPVHHALETAAGDVLPDDANPNARAALQNQLRTPLALNVMLPTGLLGLACAAMLAAFISTHDTYLHSWGTILVQDVILPFRKHPLTPRQHLRLLRLSIFGVAVFIFLFSLLFQHTQYVAMFLAITGAVFVSGAGAAIIGGLYWKHGTTLAAWSAMITGMVLSTLGIIIKQVDPRLLEAATRSESLYAGPASWMLRIQTNLTGQEMTFWAIALAGATYAMVSLIGPGDTPDAPRQADDIDADAPDWWRRNSDNPLRPTEFNMDRLLHRGQYQIEGETSLSFRDATTWLEKLGFTREFSGRDRVVTYITVGWPLAWTVIFLVVSVYNIFVDVPPESWLSFWHGWTWFILACGTVVTVWFTIGGFLDMKSLYRTLRTRAQEATPSAAEEQEDGRVEHDPV